MGLFQPPMHVLSPKTYIHCAHNDNPVRSRYNENHSDVIAKSSSDKAGTIIKAFFKSKKWLSQEFEMADLGPHDDSRWCC